MYICITNDYSYFFFNLLSSSTLRSIHNNQAQITNQKKSIHIQIQVSGHFWPNNSIYSWNISRPNIYAFKAHIVFNKRTFYANFYNFICHEMMYNRKLKVFFFQHPKYE